MTPTGLRSACKLRPHYPRKFGGKRLAPRVRSITDVVAFRKARRPASVYKAGADHVELFCCDEIFWTPDKLVMVRNEDGQSYLFLADAKAGSKVWEFAVLMTSLDLEILSLVQLYRDRGDSENPFDELKNQWDLGRVHDF